MAPEVLSHQGVSYQSYSVSPVYPFQQLMEIIKEKYYC